jgi:serine/threonine-protein kinase RsbW
MRSRPALTVSASLAAIEEIGAYLGAVAEEAGLSRRDGYRLRLAVDELATNIIVHGYQESGIAGQLVVRAEPIDEGVVVTLEDTGPAFDPRTIEMPEADLTLSLDERSVGGLGVFLAIKSVDAFDYERRGDRNVTTLTVRRRPDDTPPAP